MKKKEKSNLGRPAIEGGAERVNFLLPKKEAEEFIELCEIQAIKLSHKLQLMVARELYNERENK